MDLDLTKEEQRMLDGGLGDAARESMEILVALARIYGAKRMIPVTSSQISGVSYKTIGQAGLDYLVRLSSKGARVKVPSFLNPAGMDREQWKGMGIPPDFAKKQIEILDAFERMGIMKTCTCAPYFIGIRPGMGSTSHGRNPARSRSRTRSWAHGRTAKAGPRPSPLRYAE